MTTTTKPTKQIARKVIAIVDCGLTEGLGDQIKGQMCVEAAVCYAFGLPHGDKPPCVGSTVRDFKIRLNDNPWSSNEARAKGMRRLAIAQLGSNEIDQMEFGKMMFLHGVQELLPFALVKAANDPKVKEEHKLKFLEHAELCEKVRDFKEAQIASKNAYTSAYTSASAWFKANLGDEFLSMIAETGLTVLKKLKSPGCKWLDLCD